MNIEAVLDRLPINDETTARDAIKQLNNAISRAFPDETDRFTFRSFHQDKVGRGFTFWSFFEAGAMIVYSLEGSAEGYFIHVDSIVAKENSHYQKVIPLLAMKTYNDLEQAQKIANLTQYLLGG